MSARGECHGLYTINKNGILDKMGLIEEMIDNGILSIIQVYWKVFTPKISGRDLLSILSETIIFFEKVLTKRGGSFF